MPLGSFHAERFRCLADVELELDPGVNLFIGPNASGKTSLLEAAFFLSRGRSFRSRRRDALIAHGEDSFPADGQSAGTPWRPSRWASVAAARPRSGMWAAQPRPASRTWPSSFLRRSSTPKFTSSWRKARAAGADYLDWGVFHVEHGFLPNWRRYHQALRQRNAALKQEASDDEPRGPGNRSWLAVVKRSPQQRDAYLARLAAPLAAIGDRLAGLADHA